MSSDGKAELLDLDRDLPVTPKDVEIQRALRRAPVRISFAEYLAFLASLPPSREERRLPIGFEPFELKR